MRILLVSDLYPPWHRSGPEVVAKELHEALLRKGIDVLLLAEAPNGARTKNVILSKHYNNIVVNALNGFLVKHIELRSLFREYDIVHFEVLPGFKNLYLPEIALKAGRESVVTLHGCPTRELRLKKQGAIRALSAINVRLGLKNVFRIKNAIVNSEFMKKIIMTEYGIEPPVIPNGVDIDLFRGTSDMGLPPGFKGDQRVFYWGRISQEKGIELIIKSAEYVIERLPSCHYYIIGSGKMLEEMKQLTARLQLASNVHFLGFLPQERIAGLLRHADVALFPFISSRGVSDNAPLAILEAMAAGKAIVTTRIGGLPELIRDGWNGILAEPSPGDIGERTITLIEDKSLRERIERNALATAQSYSWDKIADRYIDYYEALL